MRRIAVAVVVTLFAFVIAAYAFAVVVLGERMFAPQLRESFLARPWGIYPHAFFGGVALLVGAFQFRQSILRRRPRIHRILGTIYVASALLTGAAGLYMAFFAYGGAITRLGFGSLAVVLLITTSLAYAKIRKRDVALHREWMLRSYALIFAAVTLRIELPILVAAFGAFEPAYRVVAWSCWVPNLLWAEIYVRATAGVPVPQPA